MITVEPLGRSSFRKFERLMSDREVEFKMFQCNGRALMNDDWKQPWLPLNNCKEMHEQTSSFHKNAHKPNLLIVHLLSIVMIQTHAIDSPLHYTHTQEAPRFRSHSTSLSHTRTFKSFVQTHLSSSVLSPPLSELASGSANSDFRFFDACGSEFSPSFKVIGNVSYVTIKRSLSSGLISQRTSIGLMAAFELRNTRADGTTCLVNFTFTTRISSISKQGIVHAFQLCHAAPSAD